MDYINNARIAFENISLTDDYRSKRFTKNFDAHLNLLIDTSNNLLGDNSSLLGRREALLTDEMYWETEAYVLEKMDDVSDIHILQGLDDLEDILYNKIRSSLPQHERSTQVNLMIDNTVHNSLLAVKFNYFLNSSSYVNPWENAKKILTENSVLHTFSADRDKLVSMGFNISDNDSEVIANKKINIIGKGNKGGFAYGYIRDLIGLRNTILDIMDEHGSSYLSPIKMENIITTLRLMGISRNDLTDSNIQSWLINPLKRSNKIGSCNEGYFLLKTCEDVAVSYDSHLENLKGYYKTLENHQRRARKLGCNDERFEQHKNFFRDI